MIVAVLVNGTVGAGKTTTAEALAESQTAKRVPHAMIDLDQIRRKWPSPDGDPFNHELELANLRDLVRNYRAAGAERFILAGVVEDRSALPEYERAFGTADLLTCRLRGDLDLLAERIRFRHAGDEVALEWYLDRVGRLDAILDAVALDDIVLDSSTATPSELARAIEVEAGW